MADAAKTAAAGGNFRLEHGARALAQQQIGVADDAGTDRRSTVAAAGAHRRGAVGKFDFADRTKRLRPVGAIHRAGLDIDGCDDVVTGRDVVDDILDQIALSAAIPQMMMRIDDRPCRIDDFFFPQRKPVLARIGIEPAVRRGRGAGGHGSSLPVSYCC